MVQDLARLAAVNHAIELVPENATIGLGSGRAVFALIEAIDSRNFSGLNAVAASSKTAKLAASAGLNIVDLDATTKMEVAFDGADEVDPQLGLIKGAGAALLREKLVLTAAKRVVILIQENKLVDRLGQTRTLPVEVVRFGWQTTQARLLEIVDTAELRLDENDEPVITDEGHLLIDVSMPPTDPSEFAKSLKQTLGVVDHGLFLDTTSEVIVGKDNGTVLTLTR